MEHYASRFLIFSILSVIITNFGCAAIQKTAGDSAAGSKAVLQADGKGICLDGENGRMWQMERSNSPFSTLQEAQQYAGNLRLGGYSDWRLPNREELFSLHYIFQWQKNGDCAMKRSGDYWVVGDKGEPAPGHWETYYLCGPEYTFVSFKGKGLGKGYVRAVRP